MLRSKKNSGSMLLNNADSVCPTEELLAPEWKVPEQSRSTQTGFDGI